MSKQSDDLTKAIRDQEGILRALESDVANPQRVFDQITAKEKEIERLQAQVTELYAALDRLPVAVEAARKRLAYLKQSQKATGASRDIARLESLLAKAAASGVDIAALLKSVQG